MRLAGRSLRLGGRPRRSPTWTSARSDAAQPAGCQRDPPLRRVPPENADFRPGRHRRRVDLDRPQPAVHPRSGRQGDRSPYRRARGPLLVPAAPRPGEGTPTRWSPSPRRLAFRWPSRRPSAAAAAVRRWPAPSKRSPSCSSRPTRGYQAFGRGECFVERHLDKPRHVEAQVIADQHGNVVVAGTRDCSPQRRFQKLVEGGTGAVLYRRAAQGNPRVGKADLQGGRILRRGHGGDTWSVRTARSPSLEVNTRLQVEHPVTGRETSGIDLVRAVPHRQRREVGHHRRSRTAGHSIEFRINGEDAGRGFLPAPGPVNRYDTPAARRALDSAWRLAR